LRVIIVSWTFKTLVSLAHSCQKKPKLHTNSLNNSSLFDEFVCKLGLFWQAMAILKRERNEHFKGPRVPKKAQERVEYNVFLFDEPLKGSKSLKIFKISLTFRFDNLSNLSKSLHTGENSQILTVSNKKQYMYIGSLCKN
jgi:hypothetical protein